MYVCNVQYSVIWFSFISHCDLNSKTRYLPSGLQGTSKYSIFTETFSIFYSSNFIFLHKLSSVALIEFLFLGFALISKYYVFLLSSKTIRAIYGSRDFKNGHNYHYLEIVLNYFTLISLLGDESKKFGMYAYPQGYGRI